MKYKIYRKSILATMVSILGVIAGIPTVFFWGMGVVSLFGGEFLLFIVGVVAGIIASIPMVLLQIWADKINEHKLTKLAIKDVRAKGLEPYIGTSFEQAVQLYNSIPCNKMLKYIESLNPEFARQIRISVVEARRQQEEEKKRAKEEKKNKKK